MAKAPFPHLARKAIPCKEVVQLPLMPEHVAELKTMIFTWSEISNYLDSLTKAGYTVQVGYEHEYGHYSCRISGYYSPEHNAGKSLYSHGKTLEACLMAGVYKHFLIAKGGPWQATISEPSDFS